MPRPRPQNLSDKEWRTQQLIDRYGPDATLPVGPTREEWKKKKIDQFRKENGPDKPLPDFDRENDMQIDYFDPKTVKEYSDIKLPVPKGLTPELVALVAMGAGMDTQKYNLNKVMSTSSPSGNLELFNQAYHYTNIASDDPRVRGYSDLLIDSRKQAQEALIAYQNGDPSLVQKHLKTLVTFAKKAALEHANVANSNSLTDPDFEMRVLVNDLINNPDYDFSDIINEKDKIMFNSTAQKIDAVDKAKEIEDKLLNDPPAAGSEERKKQAEELLFCRMLAHTTTFGFNSTDKLHNDLENLLDKYKDSYAPDTKRKSMMDELSHVGSMMKGNVELAQTAIQGSTGLYHPVNNAFEKSYVSPVDTALYDQNGINNLKEKYLPLIRELPEYQSVVNAKTTTELETAIDQVKKEKNNFDRFSDQVQLDTAKADELMFHGSIYEKTLEESEIKVCKAVCQLNAHHYNQKLIELNKAQAELPSGAAEDPYAVSLREKYTELKELNEKYDYTKGPIANDDDYRQKANEAKQLGIAYAAKKKNVQHYTQKLIELNNAQEGLPFGVAEDPYAVSLREKYTELKELNEKHDCTKGSIDNDNDYRQKVEEVKQLGIAYEEKKENEKQFDDQLTLLNSEPKSIFQRNHQDSAEIIALRQKVQALRDMNSNNVPGSGNVTQSPEYQQKLLEAYQASIAYQKKVAKSNYGKQGWEPSSEMGKDRYKGALAVEALARKMIPDLVASAMDLEERSKDIKNTNSKHDFANLYKETARSLEASQKRAPANASSAEHLLADRKKVDMLAKLIAIKTINARYEKALKTGEDKKKYKRDELKEAAETYADSIKNRADFQRMIKDNPMDQLIDAATQKDGKRLMAKLAEAHAKVGTEKAIAEKAEKAKKALAANGPKMDPAAFGKK